MSFCLWCKSKVVKPRTKYCSNTCYRIKSKQTQNSLIRSKLGSKKVTYLKEREKAHQVYKAEKLRQYKINRRHSTFCKNVGLYTNSCKLCKVTSKTQLHHLKYKWDFNKDDVLFICDACHRKLHPSKPRFKFIGFHKWLYKKVIAVV